jgi:hypothetical protein
MAEMGNLVFPSDKRRFAGDMDQMTIRIRLMRRQETLCCRIAHLDCHLHVLVRLYLLKWNVAFTMEHGSVDQQVKEYRQSLSPVDVVREALHLGTPASLPLLWLYKQPSTISSNTPTHHYS